MDINQLEQLIASIQKDQIHKIELIETHISWVLLCDNFVYKIKKPLQFAFLNFSTLELRKYYCDQELILNRRLTVNIYIKVSGIYNVGKEFNIGENKNLANGMLIDYCVKMKRLDNHLLMRNLLTQNLVTPKHIQQIVEKLINFHQKAQVVFNTATPQILWNDFSDLKQVNNFIIQHGEFEDAKFLDDVYSFVERFIKNHSARIYERDKIGFSRDCHGDLHSGNIFLLETPVIFDCIEFNEHFRQIDILNELAFFCMDLEFYQHEELSQYFIDQYMKDYSVIENQVDHDLFLFYKLYRSNVKVKVNAIKCIQAQVPEIYNQRLALFTDYLKLMKKYFAQLKGLKATTTR